MQTKKKCIWIILDSVGVGALPDAAQYGDAGSNTMERIALANPTLELPHLNAMGLYHLVPTFSTRKKAQLDYPFYWARMAEASKGKDTITGHWEFAGVITEEPFPTFPNGFPDVFVNQLETITGVSFIGNEVASGTEIIGRLGEEHMRTGKPILYTSADSVLQIAAHEDVIPLKELYRICEAARELTRSGPYKVGRVIARPFIGTTDNFTRTANRHDFALDIPKDNLLQQLLDNDIPVYAVGKIRDIYAGTPFTKAETTKSNADGMQKTSLLYQNLCEAHGHGLLYVNLVDFDMKYGHRRDCQGYGSALSEFDIWLKSLIELIDQDTILVLTADHGCDPGYSGTDHTREYVPLFIYGKEIVPNTSEAMITHTSFADLGATIAEYFSIAYHAEGTSFAETVFRKEKTPCV